jgi:hypothetical protein
MSKNSSSSLFSFSKLQSYFCYCKQFKPKMGEAASRLIFCSSALTVYFLTAFISLHCNFFFCMFLCVCLPFFLLFGLWTSFCLSLAQSVYAFFPPPHHVSISVCLEMDFICCNLILHCTLFMTQYISARCPKIIGKHVQESLTQTCLPTRPARFEHP